MRKFLFAFLILILSSSAFAQELTLPELNGYKKQTNYPVFTPDNLWDFINGAADTYLAYGFEDLHVAEYKKGKNVIKLEIYRHKDNTLAFGIYSTERSPSFRFLNIGGQGYSADGSINFYKGNYYVKIRTYSKNEKTLQAAESLALQTANMLKGDASLPTELAQFPAEGKKANEETYINESVLGHKFLNNAFKAQYQLGSDVFSIFVMDKASTKEAVTTVNEYLKQTSLEPTDEDNGKFALNDGYNGTIFLAFKNSKIVLISGLAKDQSDVAERYTSEILK
jgi:hypothetical protein